MTHQRIHFLNVAEGNCSIVQRGSGRVSVIDVNNALLTRRSDSPRPFGKRLVQGYQPLPLLMEEHHAVDQLSAARRELAVLISFA